MMDTGFMLDLFSGLQVNCRHKYDILIGVQRHLFYGGISAISPVILDAVCFKAGEDDG
jgi:hypothetical protein